MYTFIDTMEHSDHSSSLPQEAVSINGYGENSNYIENLIEGYITCLEIPEKW